MRATSADRTDDEATFIRAMELMATGTVEDFAEVYTADALDREADEHPPLRGPEGLHRSAVRLRSTFSDMRWEVHEAVQDGALVVLHTTMSGRQTGTATAYGPEGTVRAVFPSRGRSFSATQTHWFRTEGGTIAEHWANRDDLTMSRQLGCGGRPRGRTRGRAPASTPRRSSWRSRGRHPGNGRVQRSRDG